MMNGKLVPADGSPPIPLVKPKILIGRQADCDICLPFANVSSRHAELRFHEGTWVLIDRRSSNGTVVNGDKIERKRLKPGDAVTFARKYHFTIDYKPEGKLPSKDDQDVIIKKKSKEELEDIFSKSLLERAGLSKKENEDDFDPSLYFEDEEPEEKGDRQSLDSE